MNRTLKTMMGLLLAKKNSFHMKYCVKMKPGTEMMNHARMMHRIKGASYAA